MASVIGVIVELSIAEAHQIARYLLTTAHSARIATNSDGVRVSVDRGVWTLPLGGTDREK